MDVKHRRVWEFLAHCVTKIAARQHNAVVLPRVEPYVEGVEIATRIEIRVKPLVLDVHVLVRIPTHQERRRNPKQVPVRDIVTGSKPMEPA